MNTPKDKQSQDKENECSDIWTYLAESEASAWLPSNLEEYKQLNLWKSTPTLNQSCAQTFPISLSTQTSEIITQNQESLKSYQWDFPVQVHQTQELSKDSNIQLPHFGEKDLEVSLKLNPSSVLWNSLKDLSEEDLELFLPPSIWQDTVLKLKQSRRESLEHHTRDSECLSFPTLTSGQTSTKMRPAGQVKCEKWFKDKGLVQSGYQLGTKAIALMMGFPSNWFEVLSQKNSKNQITPSQVKLQEESEQDISQVEPLHQHKQRSFLEESSISMRSRHPNSVWMLETTIPFLVIDRLNLLIPAQQINKQRQVGVMTHACTSKNFRKAIKDLDLLKICDSGVFLKAVLQENLTYDELFARYEEMNADYGIIFDVLGDAKSTIKSAKSAINIYFSKRRSFNLVGVAQGQTVEQYVKCTKSLIDLGYKHIAIGGMLKKNLQSARYVRVADDDFLAEVIRSIREVWQGWLFCLGCYHPKRIQLFDQYKIFGSDSKRWAFRCDRGLSTEDRHKQLVKNFLVHSPSVKSSISTQLLGVLNNCSSKSSSTSNSEFFIPCLIKQPDRPEVKGVIQKDLGDRFIVYIPSDDSTITVSKLLVYPDFSGTGDKRLLGGLDKSSSKITTDFNKKVSDTSSECSSKNSSSPSTKSSSKKRRHKGEGSGHIYYRTVTRNGKDYQQAYYQWRENGKQRTKYIPKKLLHRVEEAERQKYPVTKILDLLQGGLEKCSSNYSSTFPDAEVLAKEDESIETPVKCSSKTDNPPCTRQKRPSGHGGGYIEYREVKRNHKVYAQYWYHWEIWRSGVRLTKKSRYIPKRLLAKVEKMEVEKVAVKEILEVLGVKG